MGIETHIDTPLAKAVRAVGSQSAFGRLVGKSQTSVFEAVRDRRLIWPEAVLKVEAATGISRHDLRPDLYPREPAPAPRSASPPAAEDAPATPTSVSPSPSGDEADDGRGVDLSPGSTVS